MVFFIFNDKLKFGEEVRKHIGQFDGTKITFQNGQILNVVRNPDSEHSKKLFKLLDQAQKFNNGIQLAINK